MNVKVDISEVLATERAAVRHLEREVPKAMERAVKQAATDERRGHSYQNRTGDLQRSTQATEPVTTDNIAQVDLVAGMDYASYVNRRGFMIIDETAQRAANEIEFFFDGASF